MLRRPQGDGRRSPQQQKLFLAFAVLLLPWLQIAEAKAAEASESPLPRVRRDADDTAATVRPWTTTTPVRVADAASDTPASPKSLNRPQHDEEDGHDGRGPNRRPNTVNNRKGGNDNGDTNKNKNKNNQPIIIPDDASALATLAPAHAVRAPHPLRHQQRSSSVPAAGLQSPQIARSLGDWEVEDFVLLATVDGDLYANDRRTGKQRWHLEVDTPMVETAHFRANSSALDEDFHAVDHYIWAVEPNQNGGIYVWNPTKEVPALVSTGFTMKRLVEELAPWVETDPPIVYTGDKKSSVITLDAATGRVLKWFGAGGSHVNEADSCLRPNGLYDADAEECSSTGTITLGRTEYTVGIQRSDDGRPIATLKYSEWSPNNFDNDLLQQHHESLDSRYITSQHDGKVYAFDYARSDSAVPLYSQKFSAPVARVFDVCRPWDAKLESNPDLIVLPQPPMPTDDQMLSRKRTTSVFLNQTESGSWYAMSGGAYPLILDAPPAKISTHTLREFGDWDIINEAKISKALIGTHSLDTFRSDGQQLTLPQGSISDAQMHDLDNESLLPEIPEIDDSTILNKVKSLPQSAANSVWDFISNPTMILLFFVALIYNEKKLRKAYHRFRTKGFSEGPYRWITDEQEEKYEQESEIEQIPDVPEAAEVKVEPKQLETVPEEQPLDGDLSGKSKVKPELERSEGKPDSPEGSITSEVGEKKKKAHRGRRGGVKHRKGRPETSQSRGDEPAATVDDAVNNAKKLGDRPTLEPDVMTVANDMQAVTGPIIKMGNIEVNTDEQLGTGSNGTLVFAGKFDGREVAVKRMLIQFYDIASQETRLLRESDDHPNVIRYYSQQTRDGFLYIALERCAASLADVVEKPHAFAALATAGQMDIPGVLYQITNGMSHLHELRIVHRDLKPQNILVNMGKDGKPRLLVSDFGLCKKLEGGQSSFGATTGRAAGTSGWRAPELLLDDDARDSGLVDASTHSGSGSVLVNDGLLPHSRRATRAIDIFSLGLVFFYVLTNGSHPFDCGDRYMREVNIRKGTYNLRPLDSLGDYAYEAKDLIASMLDPNPKMRPNAREVMSHPFFWSAKKRLAFLCDVSDHFEKEPRDPPSPALAELERHAAEVTKGDFLRVLPRDFVDSLGKQRKYTGSRLLDLLRALRNKRNHYEDMPEALKRSVGPLPEGYLCYWTCRFPMLLLVCWNVVYNVRWEETDRFHEYYEPAGL